MTYPPEHHLLRDLLVSYEWPTRDQLIAFAPVQDHARDATGAFRCGAVAAIADLIAAQAAMPLAGEDWVATRDLTLVHAQPCIDGPLVLEAQVVRAGRRMMTSRVELFDGQGREAGRQPCATATATLFRTRRESTEVAATRIPDEVGVRHSMALPESGFGKPLHDEMGIVETGAGVLILDKSPYVRNSLGTVNGGATAILAAAAAESAVPSGVVVDLTVRYVGRAGDGAVRAEATIVREHADHAAVEIRIVDDEAPNLVALVSAVVLTG